MRQQRRMNRSIDFILEKRVLFAKLAVQYYQFSVCGRIKNKAPAAKPRGLSIKTILDVREKVDLSVLGRPGSDLLFQVLRLSTIGAGKFYGRVRDGIGYRLPASTSRPAKDREASWSERPRAEVRGLDPRTSCRKRWFFRCAQR